MYKLHRIERLRLQGLCYETWVFRSDKGYTVQTQLGINDRIISDGSTETEALRDHWRMLPVAIRARNCW